MKRRKHAAVAAASNCLTLPRQTVHLQHKRGVVVFFFSLSLSSEACARAPNGAAPLVAINPNFTDGGSKSTFGEPRKLTGEDSLPSLAGAHQKVRQRVAAVPMEDKRFFFFLFSEENKET